MGQTERCKTVPTGTGPEIRPLVEGCEPGKIGSPGNGGIKRTPPRNSLEKIIEGAATMANPMRGLDANEDLTLHAECMKSQGFDFAIRYYNTQDPSKNLTLAEAQGLVRVGLQLGAVWEDGSPTHPSYFSHSKGVVHGTTAYQMAMDKIGQPRGTPIYFAVDYDATPGDVGGVIKAYFQGIVDGFNTIGQGNLIYRVGIYGSGLTCTELLRSNLVTFTWLSQSTGFRGSRAFAQQKRYNLIQLLPVDACGINIDPDETNPDKPSGLFTM
jgi:hypothetical protein